MAWYLALALPPGWLSGERVGLLTGDCELDPRLRRTFFPAYFRLSFPQKHVRKVVGGFVKKSCVSTGVRKPGNTYASPTAMLCCVTFKCFSNTCIEQSMEEDKERS